MGLYKKLADNERAQKKFNKGQAASTRAMARDARKALDSAKASFRARLLGMAGHIAKSERTMNKRYLKLTGVVRANALKDRRGRQALKNMATRRAVALQLSASITTLKRQNQHAIDQFRL